MNAPKRLIEEWLHVKEIGVESQRERVTSNTLPPLYFPHVWWSQHSLTAFRAILTLPGIVAERCQGTISPIRATTIGEVPLSGYARQAGQPG